MRNRLIFVAKLLISVGIVAFLMWKVDLPGLIGKASLGDPLYLAISALFVLLQFFIAAGRWQVVIAAIGGRLPFSEAWRLVYVGQFFNLILPSTVGGDAVRGWMIWKSGTNALTAASSVLLDRLAAVLGLVLTILATSWMLPLQENAALLNWVVFGLGVGSVGGVSLLMVLDRLPKSMRAVKLFDALAALSRDVRALLLSFPHALGSVGLGVLGQLNLSLSLYFIARAFDVPVTMVDCMVLWPLVVLVTLLPVSISGWGLREGAMVVALGLVGVADDAAVLLSVTIGLISMVVALPGGALFLFIRRSRLDAPQ